MSDINIPNTNGMESDREKIIHIQGKIDNLATKLDLSLKNITDKIESGNTTITGQFQTVNTNIASFLMKNDKMETRVDMLSAHVNDIKAEIATQIAVTDALKKESREFQAQLSTKYRNNIYLMALIISVISVLVHIYFYGHP